MAGGSQLRRPPSLALGAASALNNTSSQRDILLPPAARARAAWAGPGPYPRTRPAEKGAEGGNGNLHSLVYFYSYKLRAGRRSIFYRSSSSSGILIVNRQRAPPPP